jgi:3'-phosphoadenosine 5'-phosphosulfate (PAPS) 3'-phosphatase
MRKSLEVTLASLPDDGCFVSLMLKQITKTLSEAVIAGAREVLKTRREGAVNARFKDASELVTEADMRSDSAMLKVLESHRGLINADISFRLEESGEIGAQGAKRIGADPLDGTSHFSAGGNLYSVQAHYLEDGVPLVGVIFQPEVYLPLSESENCVGRFVSAVRGEGAFMKRAEFRGDHFVFGEVRPVPALALPGKRNIVACVPITGKMKPEERALAQNVYASGIVSASTGAGNAGGNVMMIVFGGQDVYANFGAGEELDLAPPQVIAQEVGLTVWSLDRKPPVWNVRKQPFVVARDQQTAERFLAAAGL